jgi:hypothetical protein
VIERDSCRKNLLRLRVIAHKDSYGSIVTVNMRISCRISGKNNCRSNSTEIFSVLRR